MLAARHVHRGALLVSAVFLLSCNESPTEGAQSRVPASLDIVAGDAQDGVVGTELPNPLVVRVEDANGLPIVGQVVNFRVTSGGGSVFAGAGITNAAGIVQDRWTLGTSTADSQRVEARAVNPNSGAAIVFARFRATPLPGPAQSVAQAGGDAQSGALGAALTDSLAVRVSDSFGNPVPNVSVAWATNLGNGAVSPTTSQTGTQGIAKARWILGTRLDLMHEVSAAVATLTPVRFTASPMLPATARIIPVAGEGATGTVGAVLTDSLAVRVELGSGESVAGASVTWTVSGAAVSPPTSTTQADGVARTQLTFGTVAGPREVSISVSGLSPATMDLTAGPDVPASITKTAGDGQTGVVADLLSQPLVVRVVDRFGNAVPNVLVDWNALAGTVAPVSPATDADGRVAAAWTLGQVSGPQTLTATVSGLPAAQFSAAAGAGAVSSLVVVSGSGQSATAGSALPSLVEVHAMDRFGNAASGETISFAASGGGSFSPPTAVTESTGRVASRWTLGTTAGTQTATISSNGISITVTASAISGTAAALATVSGDGQAGIAGDLLAQPLIVRVTDANSNPVAGIAVTWSATSSCGSVSSISSMSDAWGLAQTAWTLGPAGRLCTGVTATIGDGTSARFTARFLGRTAQLIDPGNFVEQVGTIDVPVPLTATVTDDAENPVPGITVGWSRTEGNGLLAGTTSVTDSSGRATVVITPGTVAGNNRVLASVTGLTGAEYLVWTRALAAERVVIVDGNNQTGEPGQPLAQPIRVRVEDRHGNGVYNEAVTLQVSGGGGHLERTTLRTDPSGLAATVWVLGSVGGQEVRASWNATSVVFSATGVQGTRDGLLVVAGNEQVATTSFQREHFMAPMTVRVVDGRGDPVSGVPVTWAGDFSPVSVVSDAAGVATLENARMQLLAVGTRTITATLPNGTVARLTLIVESGGGGAFAAPSHTGSATARVGRRLPGRVVVLCSDRMGGASACSIRTRDANFASPAGQLHPAPGIFPPGRYEFFWVLPETPGTYYFEAAAALPNAIAATAVP